ncbi:hypothetical protein [Reichenbachiella sp.]|uniref:hypothetical protein n=1 Tax=Reichenbachiella sp. TaxID=2184521 RepID=UPI003BAECDFC
MNSNQSILDSIQLEVLHVLRFYKALIRLPRIFQRAIKAGHDGVHIMTGGETPDFFIYAKCLENDLIVRISKLMDRSKKSASIHTYMNLNKSSLPNDCFIRYQSFLDTHSKLISRRMEFLAHLKQGNKDNFDPDTTLYEPIKDMVELVDYISQERQNYSWKDNMLSEDLREQLGV